MTAYTTPFILYGLDADRGGHCRVTYLRILFILLLINDRKVIGLYLVVNQLIDVV